jgi:murein DD-endopeptidase MepM/ murein hydrolase activator NlpD
MPAHFRPSLGRALLVALALIACAGLVFESPLFARSDHDELAKHRHTPGSAVRIPALADTVLVRGFIRSTLHDAVYSAAARALPIPGRAELAWRLADVFEYRVDMSRDLVAGDEVRVLVERALRPDGSVYASDMLAARLTVGGSPVEAVRFRRGAYVDRRGRSLRATFLRAPLNFRRVSSVFGMRYHPILGRWREHRGIDYAAHNGTPVRTVGDGVVIFAGWRGSYGNLVEVAHAGGMVTRYAHLRGYARGTRPGTRVRVGQTIGFVGSTGLSTGPHLHFEMLINGRYADPRHALDAKIRDRLRWAGPPDFDGRRARLLAALGS